MALRIEWDKLEVALLIDACEQVLNKNVSKPQIVSKLSASLRLRAQNNGVEIDDIFRNENGISLQMTKMDYLLTNGKIGLPGASKLYAEIAELRKSHPEEFACILKQAKEQIGEKESKALMSNKEKFSLWLSSHPSKKYTPEQIIKALEDGADYCKSHGICKESYWDIAEIKRFSEIASRLSGMRLFRLTNRKLASVLDKAFQLYKEFLRDQDTESDEASAKAMSRSALISGEKEPETQQIPQIELVYSKDDSDDIVRIKLDLITKLLLQRYSAAPATSLAEIVNNNKDLPVSYINTWTKMVEDQTAAQYLIAKGVILKAVDNRSEEEKRAEKLNKLNEVTSILLTRYAGKPITSLTELIKQNPDLAVSSVSFWAKELFGQTASEYFREKGILLPVVEKTPSEKLQDAIIQIKASLGDSQIHSLSDLKECGIRISIPTLNNWTKSVYGKPVSEFLIEENILARDSSELEYEQIKDAPDTSRSDIKQEDEDDADGEPIDAMELSLFKTLEYLKTRYNVRQHYDHIINSERTTLYKVRNRQKDIMWVYYIHTKSSHYISIETEPEYLEDMSSFPGFTRIQKRASHPRQKMFFEDFGAIWQTLVAICNSIDRYFAAFIPEQSQLNRVKLYQKLYSISKVYDDPGGIALSKIMSMVGKDADEQVVKDILADASWAYRLTDGNYSFAQRPAIGRIETVSPKPVDMREPDHGNDQAPENSTPSENPIRESGLQKGQTNVNPVSSSVNSIGSDDLANNTTAQVQKKDPIIAFLERMEIQYLDNRSKEGRLWILGDLSLKGTTAWLRGQGYSFIYCYRGSKSTNWKSAWYLDESQNQRQKEQNNSSTEQFDNGEGTQKNADSLSSDLNQILSDSDMQLLRSELVKQKILSLELFRRVDLLAFMKRHAIYNISQRRDVFERVAARLGSSESGNYDYQYKLETSYIAFYGDTPAEAFVSFCEHIAEKNPLKMQTLLDEKYRGQGSVVLSKTDSRGYSLRMTNIAAYVNKDLSAQAAIVYGQWICQMCGDNDPPVKLIPPSMSKPQREEATEKIQPSFDKEKLEQTLLRRYRNGMKFDSIDFENFREMYNMLFDEKLSCDDSELEQQLMRCGVFYKDRLFPAEGIIDNDARGKLFAYIESCFSSGKIVLYYKAIFEDLADVFATCYTLADEEMLRAYLEFTTEKGKYYFSDKYLSKEQNVTIDHNAEVADYLLSAGKPMSIEDVASALSHIPQDQVQSILYSDNRFLCNFRGRNAQSEYFHKGIFEVSKDELEEIANIINEYISENEYAIWTDVWNQIKEKMPAFIENNLYLSWLGVRNAISPLFAGRFNFNSAVISSIYHQYEMKDVFQLYAKHHPSFSADDIYSLSKELDTPVALYLWALAEVSVRVSHDLFVSKDQITFDVDAVDAAIGSFMAKDYIRLREIDSFLVFPNVGYSWNEYLLESFVLSYSKKYVLMNNGMALHNVAGAIVKRNSPYKEYVDVCAVVLADSDVELITSAALDFLAEQNMITQRRYKSIELAIQKASQIRAVKR